MNSLALTTLVLPYRKGDRCKIVNDYFGKIPESRLKVSDKYAIYLTNGKFRSKTGIFPQRAVPIIYSYDAKINILSLIEFTIPENTSECVNSA